MNEIVLAADEVRRMTSYATFCDAIPRQIPVADGSPSVCALDEPEPRCPK